MNIKRIVLTLLFVMSALCLKAQIMSSDIMNAGPVSGPIHVKGDCLVNSIGAPIDKQTAAYYFTGTQYDECLKATRRAKTGDVLTSIGAGVAGFGLGFMLGSCMFSEDEDVIANGYVVFLESMIVSTPFLAVGIPMWCSAKHNLNELAAEYNESIKERSSYKPTLTVGGTSHGIGIALNF